MLVVTTGRSVFVLVGIGLIIAGMALRWYAIHLLGQSFTVEVATRPGQAVVERGPYRLIRHPSYAGTLVTIIGVLVACANPVAVLGLIPALIAYSYRVRVEERALTEGLGEAYRAYMRRTRRLIPFLY
jgi:protein-S-isoprenylcysteine O-methyltransferase Ste14